MRRLRWWIAGLLWLVTLINYVDRQCLSVLAPVLRDEFAMSGVDYGRVVSAFMLAYLIGQTVAGRLMDWLGTRAGFALCVIWWSAAAMLHGAVRSALQLGAARFLLGLAQAGNWPGGVKAVSEWFPLRERAFAVGLFNSGSTVGAMVAPPLVAALALTFGWRLAFVITGATGFLWLAAWLVLYKAPERHPWLRREELELIQSDRAPETRSCGVRWAFLLRQKPVWGLVLGRMLADPVWWFYVFWLPEYLKRERHFSLAMIGYFGWIPFLAAVLGCLAGGAASGRLIKRGHDTLRARKAVMLACALLMMCGIPAATVAAAWGAIALISVATFAYSAWASNILTLPADLFPPAVVASVSGLSGTGAATGGMAFMLLIGYVVDRFSYAPVFVAAGVMPLAAFAIVAWGVRLRNQDG
jgi:ACS family hexuronate transporter-like MFS transporter